MRVALCDVGPGDGLQNEPEILGPTVRAELDKLIEVAEWLEGVLGRQLPGRVYRAGGFSL